MAAGPKLVAVPVCRSEEGERGGVSSRGGLGGRGSSYVPRYSRSLSSGAAGGSDSFGGDGGGGRLDPDALARASAALRLASLKGSEDGLGDAPLCNAFIVWSRAMLGIGQARSACRPAALARCLCAERPSGRKSESQTRQFHSVSLQVSKQTRKSWKMKISQTSTLRARPRLHHCSGMALHLAKQALTVRGVLRRLYRELDAGHAHHGAPAARRTFQQLGAVRGTLPSAPPSDGHEQRCGGAECKEARGPVGQQLRLDGRRRGKPLPVAMPLPVHWRAARGRRLRAS